MKSGLMLQKYELFKEQILEPLFIGLLICLTILAIALLVKELYG